VLVWSFEPVANGGDSYSRKIQMEGLSDAGQSEGLETLCFPGNNNPPGKCELSAQLSVLSKWWVVLAFWNCVLLFVLWLVCKGQSLTYLTCGSSRRSNVAQIFNVVRGESKAYFLTSL
jgi:hypothetical protein